MNMVAFIHMNSAVHTIILYLTSYSIMGFSQQYHSSGKISYHNILQTPLSHNWMLKVIIGDDLCYSVYLVMNGRYVLNKLPKFESMISEELCNEQCHKLFFNIYKNAPQTNL